MTDYVNILSRAIADKPSYEERRGVYERARQALVAQLRKADPPLSESDITKQRLALENAIRDVESQASGGKAASKPAGGAAPETHAGKAGNAAVESIIEDEQPLVPPATPAPVRLKTFAADLGEGKGDPLLARVATHPKTALKHFKRPNNLTMILAAVGLVAFLGILTSWYFVHKNVASDNEAALIIGNKIADRVAQDESLQAQGATVAQTAYLVEENIDAQKGFDTFRGKVTWRIDTQAASEGGAPEKIIRGLVEIPDRNLKMLMTIRRADQALQASHTIELLFDVPKDFIHGAVERIGVVRMKPSEQATGLPLASAAVRITTGFFLIGLSVTADDINKVLLRDRPWFDIAIFYRNGRRAGLALEKGVAGENVFNEAFKAWDAN